MLVTLPQGEPRPDLHVLHGSGRLANIRAIHGPGVAKELLALEVGQGEDLGPHVALDAPMAFKLTVSGAAAGAAGVLAVAACTCAAATASAERLPELIIW